ncbi:MAG TPA: metal ABC transporter permease [Candidatus Sulfotelmatobacter sp.]|jgi:zinc/manganese transport system permease protein|nr:metal ABC transporter permease [Candidatus Sulfotelmatobacter sp.]
MFDILQYSFIQNAFIASFFVSIVAAIVGYFMLARGLTFAGHAFSHVGFAGAAGAVWLGINPLWGLLSFTIAAAIAIGSIGRQFRERDVPIGIIFTLALAFGVLFLFLYSGYAEEAYSILFGTILGISSNNVFITAFFSMATIGVIALIFRPLLFSSFDPEVAEARGVPVQFLSILFLVLIAITVSISVQVVGVLLIFTLLIGPAATAMRLVKNPYSAIGLAILLGLLYSWVSIYLAAITNLPVSFFIATISFSVYLPIRLFVTTKVSKKL